MGLCLQVLDGGRNRRGLYLGETETGENFWLAELFVSNSPIHFKIDARADVIVIPESIHENIIPAPDLLRPTKTLFGPDGAALPVLGCFTGSITKGETLPQEILAVARVCQALLGRPPIESMGIFQRVNAVEAEEIKSMLPKLFKGLGELDCPDYIIKLKPDAKPHGISTQKGFQPPSLQK